jgi:hypothetical protein
MSTRAILEQWAFNGTDLQRKHARARLAMGLDPEQPQHAVHTPAYPSKLEQLGNVAAAVKNWMASGFAGVDQAEQARRLAVCHGCPHYDASQDRCTLCGCVMTWKVKLESEHCPDVPPRW